MCVPHTELTSTDEYVAPIAASDLVVAGEPQHTASARPRREVVGAVRAEQDQELTAEVGGAQGPVHRVLHVLLPLGAVVDGRSRNIVGVACRQARNKGPENEGTTA